MVKTLQLGGFDGLGVAFLSFVEVDDMPNRVEVLENERIQWEERG